MAGSSSCWGGRWSAGATAAPASSRTSPRDGRGDPAAGQAELDEVVEDAPGRRPTARRPASRTAPWRHSRPASRMCRRWGSSSGRIAAACRAPARARVAGGEGLRRRRGRRPARWRRRSRCPRRSSGSPGRRRRRRAAPARGWVASVRLDSGSWWPTQSVPPAVAPGSSASSRSSRCALRRPSAGGQQLAVPDVAQAVAAVEGPGVRRLPAGVEDDDLGRGPCRRGRGVAAERDRHRPRSPGPAPGGPPSGRRRRRRRRWPRAASSSRTRCRWCTHRAPGARTSAAPAARPPRPGGGRTPRAGRPTCCAPSARSTPRAPRRSRSRGTGVQSSTTTVTPASSRRSMTCGAMPSPQDLSRGKSARSSSATRSDGSTRRAPIAVAAPAGPAPTIARSQVVMRRDRQRAARRRRGRWRRGVERRLPRPARRRRPAPRRARAPPPPTRPALPDGPSAAVTEAADEQHGRDDPAAAAAPRRCGSPRTPVAASSSRSGSVLRKCAATPSAAAGGHHPQRAASGAGRRPASPRRAASRTRRRTGSQDQRRALEHQVVEVPACRRRGRGGRQPAAPPDQQREDHAGDGRHERGAAGRRRASARRWPAACRRGRPAGRASASTRSLPQPIVSWPARTAAVTTMARRGRQVLGDREQGHHAGDRQGRTEMGGTQQGRQGEPRARRLRGGGHVGPGVDDGATDPASAPAGSTAHSRQPLPVRYPLGVRSLHRDVTRPRRAVRPLQPMPARHMSAAAPRALSLGVSRPP